MRADLKRTTIVEDVQVVEVAGEGVLRWRQSVGKESWVEAAKGGHRSWCM